MKILVDFTQIPISRTGVGVYAENLVRDLSGQLAAEDELFILVQRDEQAVREIARHHPRVVIQELPLRLFRNRACLFLFEQTLLPLVALWLRIDVLHSLHYTHPLLCSCARAVTIHDLTFIRFPELHTRGRRLIMPFFIKRAMKHAEALIFVSHATLKDAESLIQPGENIRAVVPLGVELNDLAVSPSNLIDLQTRLSIPGPFFLFLGTLEPRKNLGRLLEAFEALADESPDITLVIAGKLGWHYEAILDGLEASRHKGSIRRLGFISEQDKALLLGGCVALVYPSLYEGFGLPVLEAMAAGAAVITSNLSSLPEVAGDAAMLVDPYSVSEIGNAMRRVLLDPALRERMALLGRRRAAEFPWRLVADRTYCVYSRVVRQ